MTRTIDASRTFDAGLTLAKAEMYGRINALLVLVLLVALLCTPAIVWACWTWAF